MPRILQLLLLFGIAQAVWPASIFELPDLTRRIPERSATPGCAYKGARYTHGEQVATREPCLNCTCIRAVVVCYLRVCPAAPTPPPGCFLAREVGQCCPILECGGGRPKVTDSDESTTVPELRPTFQPDPPKTTTAEPEENSLVFVTSTEPDEDTEFPNDIPGGCLVNGTLYGDGSAMLSSSFCEYCFCIRGKTTCLKPKCDLVIEGCTPMYDSNFTCCPSRYECYKKTTILETTVTTEAYPISSTAITYETTVYDSFAECVYDDSVYQQGEEIENYRSCHSCFCNNATITCEQIQCSPPIAGCQPIIPEGHCCPVSYKCDYHNDAVNHNTKGGASNITGLASETKKTNIKTVKQSELFKNSQSSDAEESSKTQPIQTDLSSFFNNLVPPRGRMEEDTAELYLSSDEFNSGEDNPDMLEDSSDSLKSWRENHKTLKLNSEEHSENDTENSNMQTASSGPSKKEPSTSQDVIMGIPEEKTMIIEDMLNDHFFNRNNYSTLVTKASFEQKRNNSKHAANIGNDLEISTTPVFYNTEKLSTYGEENDTDEVTEDEDQPTSPSSDENDETTFQDTANMSLNSNEDSTSSVFEPTNFGLSSASTIEDEQIELEDTSLPIINTDTQSTFSIPPLTGVSIEYFQPTGYETTLEDQNSPSPSNNETEPEHIYKSSTRINSKLPPFPSHQDSSESFSDESLTDFYLPALGRAENDDDDFTNVGAIHLGAPLSVAATHLGAPLSVATATRRDPVNLRNKITESGGIIFMDPKYTDIHPNVPSTPNQPIPTVTNPIKDTASSEQYSTPIRRSDIEYAKPSHDLKKGPRIQDVYNQTNMDFKIIPFVAEDAIRGLQGKGQLVPVDDATQGAPDLVSDFCFVRGRIYKNGELINKPDPCEMCRCFYGQELCQLQRCPSPPPGCQPEKLPNFCCPRYTCEKLPENSQVLTSGLGVITNISFPSSTKKQIEVTQSSPTTTRKPELVRTPENPREDSSSTFTGMTRSSFTKVSTTKQSSTTKQPDTTKASNSHFLDPWGLLQVSGCNIYGKFFNINDQVEILSGPCSHCICTVNGVECNDIC